MRRNVLQHTISGELYYQLVQTAQDLQRAEGGHERMILTEQYDTLQRFIDNPHAIPEAFPLRPEQLVRGTRYLS